MKMQNRIILHCDANNFFASVETISKPELKGKPVAVSGNPQKRTGIILAKNEIAKRFGVKTGEPIWQAKQKCPDLICLEPHHDLYEKYSQKLQAIYLSYTDKVESFGIDECWLDITGSMRLFKDSHFVANQIRQRVKSELGLTVSVGISFCKIFAKLGSDLKKPDAVTEIKKENFKQIIYPLKIEQIVGIGRQMSETLHKMNVYTLGDYVALPTNLLDKKFGKVGVILKEKLEGFDFDDVKAEEPVPQSVGNGTTTVIDISTPEEIKTTIAVLSEKIASRLREKKLLASGVSLALKTNEFETSQKDRRLHFPTNSAQDITALACEILHEFWDFSKQVRSVRVKCFALVGEDQLTQASLFTNPKLHGLGLGIDALKNKYGDNIITIASSLNSKFLRW